MLRVDFHVTWSSKYRIELNNQQVFNLCILFSAICDDLRLVVYFRRSGSLSGVVGMQCIESIVMKYIELMMMIIILQKKIGKKANIHTFYRESRGRTI